MEGFSPPTQKVEFSNQIFAVEFSPYEWSQNLICLGLSTEIIVGVVKFQEDQPDEEEDKSETEKCVDDECIEFQPLREFHHETRVQALAWSPDSSIIVMPRLIRFCSAGSDHKLRLINSDLVNSDGVQILTGHTDYINAIAFHPDGHLIASASDDHTCRLWNIEDDGRYIFHLDSPAMSVCWHPEEPKKLIVGEKAGRIRLYNAIEGTAILSVDAGGGGAQTRSLTYPIQPLPLTSAHWSLSNPQMLAALVGSGAKGCELVLWDLARPSQPVDARVIHHGVGRCLRFCPSSDLVVATVCQPGAVLRVTHLRSSHPLLTSNLQVYGGLTWHSRLPYVCAASDRKLCFWKIAPK
ncbi:nucleoporin Nup37 isoform X1 [Hetaerina americana]|uniref:nucleoporin Nup37 isoform X1 n=1 Tax=Hetaerina americana TaxID=62018 RepID=UPI003A7F11D4